MATAAPKTTAKTAAKASAKKADSDVKSALVNESMFKSVEDYTASAREQFETMMQSFTGNMDGMRETAEDLAEEMRDRMKKSQDSIAEVNAGFMEAAQTEVADAVQFANNIAQAKSFADALEIQQDYWTKLFESRMERAREMTEASVEAARGTMAPVETSFTSFFDVKAFEKFFPFSVKA